MVTVFTLALRVYVSGWWAQEVVRMSIKNMMNVFKRWYPRCRQSVLSKRFSQKSKCEVWSYASSTSWRDQIGRSCNDVKELWMRFQCCARIIKLVIQGGHDTWQITDFIKKNEVRLFYIMLYALVRMMQISISRIRQRRCCRKLVFHSVYTWKVVGMFATFHFRQVSVLAMDWLRKKPLLFCQRLKFCGWSSWNVEVGKEATFIISKGDVLDVMSSQITSAYISGKPVDLGSKQKELYDKYMKNSTFQIKMIELGQINRLAVAKITGSGAF